MLRETGGCPGADAGGAGDPRAQQGVPTDIRSFRTSVLDAPLGFSVALLRILDGSAPGIGSTEDGALGPSIPLALLDPPMAGRNPGNPCVPLTKPRKARPTSTTFSRISAWSLCRRRVISVTERPRSSMSPSSANSASDHSRRAFAAARSSAASVRSFSGTNCR